MIGAALKNSSEYRRLERMAKGAASACALFGMSHAARAAVLAGLCEETGRTALVITAGESEAVRFAADAEALGVSSAVYPQRDFVLRNIEGQSREYEYRRLEVLGRLVSGRVQLVCAPIEALLQHTLPKAEFLSATCTIKPGLTLPQNELIQTLTQAGYLNRPQVEGPGQFSKRGDIIDFYAPDMETPVRLEYWGDEIESLSSFDPLSQRRETALEKAYLSPTREVLFFDTDRTASFLKEALSKAKGQKKERLDAVMQGDLRALSAGVMPEGMDRYLCLRYPKPATVLDYMEHPLLFFDEPSAIREEAAGVAFRFGEEQKHLWEEGLLTPELTGFYTDYVGILQAAAKQTAFYCENFSRSMPDVKLSDTVNFPAHSLPPWRGEVAALCEELRPLLENGYFCMVLAGTPRAAKALTRDLSARNLRVTQGETMHASQAAPGTVCVLPGRLSSGADAPTARFALFTSRREDEPKKKKKPKNKNALANLSDITAGDYVVHQGHGIGLYVGIQRLDLQGVVKDYLKISYDKSDTLYVPVTQLDLLSRYTPPGDNARVKLSRLGADTWAKAKSRVRKATEEMAEDLIELYAKRQNARGHAFAADGEWQRDFEARFAYDETQDQLHSTHEIKRDMEKPNPMDRLLSGDVGVGKTEVALRAAFKCVMDGRQCAILVPTTILAWQHYNTLITRMEAFPVKIGLLSRFATQKQTKETLAGIKDGTVDIVVGTHRLLQKDIRFKTLGLLIVDEEQRFGVRHKEKLKESFVGVDTLTLSATPIPRTLNMAMSGIRDMSTIEEPPTERQPVETYVMEYDEALIFSAIKKELARGGQVYYLHNRVDSIESCAHRLSEALPTANIATAHGRMGEEALSRTWQELLDGDIDILVCTTLIETGIDVRNCNTLIIENADHMGLAQLYQIRGRVGRSGRKAYAYFTFRRDKVLTDVAAKRLSAIREFTAFGSGFRIAMRDLQIRGAGNLLGQSQSGHMEAVGYDLYVKMLNEAVAKAKGETPAPDKADVLIDITVDAYIPDRYIPSAAGRIEAYKKIAAVDSGEAADDVLAELKDRYGDVPEAVRGLVDISLLRVLAASLGFYDIVQQRDAILLYSDTLDFAAAHRDLKAAGIRVLVNASTKPYLSAKLKPGDKPLNTLSSIIKNLAFMQEDAPEE